MTIRALFWSKTGDWYEVDPGLEAEAFLEGVPRGAKKLQLTAAPGGGFSESGGRLGRSRVLELEAALVCCHGGPGEDGTLQAALDLAGIRYSGPTWPVPPWAWTSWRSDRWWPPTGCPPFPECC